MTESIHISFTYKQDEYIRAIQRHFKITLRVKFDVAIASLMIAIGSYLIYDHGVSLLNLLLIISGVALLAIIGYALFILPRLTYSNQPKLKNQYDLIFSDNGIEFTTTGIRSTLEWSIYSKWISDAEFYILYYGKRDMTVIPKRAFLNEVDNHAFQNLLSLHIVNSKI